MLLRNFWQWRDAKQEFVKLDEMVEKSRLTLLKRALLLIYPEKAPSIRLYRKTSRVKLLLSRCVDPYPKRAETEVRADAGAADHVWVLVP